MSTLSIHIQRQLVTKGWAVFDSDSAKETRATLAQLGEVVHRARVPHQPDRRVHAVADPAFRQHSGDPAVRWLSWHCVSPEPTGRAILLRPAWIAALGLAEDVKEGLRQTTFGVRPTLHGDAEHFPALRDVNIPGAIGVRDWLFFLPWLWREGANEPLDAFVHRLQALPVDAVRLHAGQALLVDNARVLHGFEPSPEAHRTLLIAHSFS
jgi:hypothetical protein